MKSSVPNASDDTVHLGTIIFAYSVALADAKVDVTQLARVVHHGRIIEPSLIWTRRALQDLVALGGRVYAVVRDPELSGYLQRISDEVALHPLTGDDPSVLRRGCIAVRDALIDPRMPRWFMDRGEMQRTALMLGSLIGTIRAGLRWNSRILVGLSAYISELTALPPELLGHVRAIALYDGTPLDGTSIANIEAHMRILSAYYIESGAQSV